MDYNKDGIKYFINLCTYNDNKYMLLPKDIRRYIWRVTHSDYFLECYVFDKLFIKKEEII